MKLQWFASSEGCWEYKKKILWAAGNIWWIHLLQKKTNIILGNTYNPVRIKMAFFLVTPKLHADLVKIKATSLYNIWIAIPSIYSNRLHPCLVVSVTRGVDIMKQHANQFHSSPLVSVAIRVDFFKDFSFFWQVLVVIIYWVRVGVWSEPYDNFYSILYRMRAWKNQILWGHIAGIKEKHNLLKYFVLMHGRTC